jgi:hypothetical protein
LNGQRLKIDVRKFLAEEDYIIEPIANTLLDLTSNEIALNCQRWVIANKRYKTDDATLKVSEFWRFPYESIVEKEFDCEDGAILMAQLMLSCGVEPYRVKVAAGWVKPNRAAESYTVGHAYCLYLADRKESVRGKEWVVLDWCYYPDEYTICEKKPLAKDGGLYGDVWFTFNHQYTWGNAPIYEMFK